MNTLSRSASPAVAAPEEISASTDAAMARMHAAMAQPGTQVMHSFAGSERRFLVIAEGTAAGRAMHVQR